MTITLDTPMLGPVDCTTAQILAALDADRRPHVYSAAERLAFAEALVHWTERFGLRTSIVAAQCLHETGRLRFGGQVKPGQRNYAGLGATNDGAAGASFGSISDGVRAVCSHHMAYIYGAVDRVPAEIRPLLNSPRYQAVLSAGYGGVVTAVGDYTNGRWAYSPQYPVGSLDNGYARALVRVANEILGYPRGEETMSAEQAFIQRVQSHGVEAHDARTRMTRHKDLRYQRLGLNWTYTAVHHTAVERHPASLVQDIASWDGHARYHVHSHGWPGIAYAVGISPSGRVLVLRDFNEAGYHAYNTNSVAFAVSCDTTSTQEPTPAMLRSLNVVLKVLHTESPELPNLVRSRTYGHKELAFHDPRNASTACPGRLLPYVQQYRAGQDFAVQVEPPKPEVIQFGEVPYIIGGGFAQRYRDLGPYALPTLGLPLSNEFRAKVGDTVRTCQIFERAGVLAWYPVGTTDGVEPDNPWHIRVLTLAEADQVRAQLEQQSARGEG